MSKVTKYNIACTSRIACCPLTTWQYRQIRNNEYSRMRYNYDPRSRRGVRELYECVCQYVCMFVCMYLCVYGLSACMYVCMSVCLFVRAPNSKTVTPIDFCFTVMLYDTDVVPLCIVGGRPRELAAYVEVTGQVNVTMSIKQSNERFSNV